MDKISTTQMHSIDTNDIRKAVETFIAQLNIKEGSNGADVDFYELLQAYIRKPNCREAINKIVKEHVYSK